MKKLFFLSIILFGFNFDGFGQLKLGLRFSPEIVNSRVDQFSDTLDIEDNGKSVKLGLGLVVDYAMTDTYYFSSGLFFVPKKVGVFILGDNGGSYINPEEEYNLQYLQVPISLKLYTNEIQPDFSVYFQVGISGEVLVFDEPMEEEYVFVEEFRKFDSSAILGAGVEYRAGVSTALFGGVSYNRGLVNTIKSTIPTDDELFVRSTVFNIDLGIKF